MREELRPYTRKLMKEAHEKGTPVMRPLFYEFPHDKKCWDISTQYLYGDKYLVCPVLKPGQTKSEVYLPQLPQGEKWGSFTGDESYESGKTVAVDCPLTQMPVFVRGA